MKTASCAFVIACLIGAVAGRAPAFDRAALVALSTLALDDSANGATVRAAPGQPIDLTLGSTYWHIDGSSDPRVVSPDAPASAQPAAPGRCPPGVGCGAIRMSFTARAPGTARIAASRTVCGEALACRPDQRSFSVTIVVH